MKSPISSLPSFFVLIYSPLESALELLYMQNYTIFAIAESRVFGLFVCKLGIATVLAIYNLQSCTNGAS